MRFKKPKGRRIKNVGFWHCTAFVNPTSDLWYQNGSEKERGKWVKRDELKDTILTNYCHPVRSVRAFRRRLKAKTMEKSATKRN
jgi:hypothetical protein